MFLPQEHWCYAKHGYKYTMLSRSVMWQVTRLFQGYRDECVMSVACSNAGRKIAAGSVSGVVRLFDAATLQETRVFQGTLCLYCMMPASMITCIPGWGLFAKPHSHFAVSQHGFSCSKRHWHQWPAAYRFCYTPMCIRGLHDLIAHTGCTLASCHGAVQGTHIALPHWHLLAIFSQLGLKTPTSC